NDLQWGTRTVKGRLVGQTSIDAVQLSLNRRLDSSQDDATKPRWLLQLTDSADQFQVLRAAAGSATGVALVVVDSAARLSVPGPSTAEATDQSSIVFGSRLALGRVMALPGIDLVALGGNSKFNGSGWVADDTTKAQWRVVIDLAADAVRMHRTPGTGGSTAVVFEMKANRDLAITGGVATKATGTTWANPSDRRLKKNIQPYATGLDAIAQLAPVSFQYNGKGGSHDGLPGDGLGADAVASV